jgi:PEGA domain
MRCLLAALLCAVPLMAQTPAATPASVPPKAFTLEDGTPVKVRINRTVSSADAQVGDTIDFEVLEEVRVNDVLVIPKGGLAFATVTAAQAKRRMARGGKLDINIDYVRLLDDEKAALRAVKELKGGGHTGAMTGAIVATSLVLWPAAPFFLFMHGKDITIPKGTEITAYASGDMKLDLAKFQPVSATPQTVASATTTAQSQLQITSTPGVADIEIDGSFVGDTPSTVGVAPGQHEISIKKPGFKPWERKIAVSSGQVNVNATLEQEGK